MNSSSQSSRKSSRFRSLTLGGALTAALGFGMIIPGIETTPLAQAQPAVAKSEEISTAQDLSQAFKQVARTVKPSVVSIRSIRHARPSAGGTSHPLEEFFGDDLFRRFFGDQMPQFNVPRQAPQFEQEGLGSGVIVSEEGYILTNNHVVANADELEVRLPDDRTYVAEVVGTDAKTDLAVLKIDAEDLTPARLGNSGVLEVGDWVVAIGSPYGFDLTVTTGIVSATGRSRVGIVDYEDFIQTDAAINPGNSGGPLTNLQGEVVGVNTAIVSRAGGWNGIGLAIPIDMARNVMDSIISEGRVIRGWMGVAIQDLTADLAESFNYDSTEGVLVGDVNPGSPAEAAGIQSGDIIVSYDGEEMENVTELRNAVAASRPGSTVRLQVFRNGDTETLRMKVGELEDQVAMATGGVTPDNDEDNVQLDGIKVETLTDEIAAQLDLEGVEGVVVTSIEPGSAAQRAGLRVGAVIVQVGSDRVRNLADFRNAAGKADLDEGVRLKVHANGYEQFLFLKSR